MFPLFVPPGVGRLLTVPQLIGAFAGLACYPLIHLLVKRRMPDADSREISKVTGCITVGLCFAVIAVMLFILHI